MISEARAAAHTLRKHLLRVRPMSQTPYATHLPILAALARIYSIRRVLELGSGPYSTSLYLDRRVFPDLEVLVSLEDDFDWGRVVLDAVGEDARLDLRMVSAVREAVPKDLSGFDLIFVDDSRTSAERSATIASVFRASPSGIVVVHDYEQRCYRVAARGFSRRFIFSTFTPQVGVCWNSAGISPERLRQARSLIDRESSLAVTDVESWREILSRL
jgi:predicted O-methyltransferase YrrM